jgi:RsiW-degrading membrane proteinase PrsW (M82 family)
MEPFFLASAREVLNIREIVIFTVIGGIIPALLWLRFWLKEDKKRPEPKKRILLTFIFGMIVGVLVIPVQYFFEAVFVGGLLIIILSAFTEEFRSSFYSSKN